HLRDEKYLIVALGATHMSVTDHDYAQDALAQNNITNELISAETDNLKEVIKGLSLAFILQFNTSENPYQPFLSANYVQSLSNQKIQLRFTQEIPQSLENWLNGINLTNYISH
ncbi:MAG TPA: dienelactone hydrolase, partial [Allocoleopsis sp.]